MGGRIRVASVVGHGSSFAVDVPSAARRGNLPSSTSRRPRRPPRPSPSIPDAHDFAGAVLVAEDNALNQEIAVELMTMAGASVETASTREAAEAFAASDAGQFDLVLMDVHTPELDGYGAARAIRPRPPPDASTWPFWP